VLSVPSWPVLGTLGAGVANLVLVGYVWPYRDEPGGRWFLAVIAIQVLWCFSYGLGLLVFDPQLRLLLELLTWIPINWIGVIFLGFALEYTGRVNIIRSPFFAAVVTFATVSTLLTLTNPLHQVVWSDFAITPLAGAATVTYTHHAWLFVQFIVLFALTAASFFILIDTVVSYGPLFRKQTVALALTVVPPGTAYAVWLFELGPAPALNLAPIMFLPHMLLDLYALFGHNMFEFKPATRRAGERAAIDDIGTPVVIVDPDGRFVNLNDAAGERFGVEKRAALTRPLNSLYDGDSVALEDGEQAVSLRIGEQRREFNVDVTPLRDPADRTVGYTVAFQDVTRERQRKQRLDVLNRILRHNLRNDLSVVINYAELVASMDGEGAEYAERIESQSRELVALGEKARDATAALDGDTEYTEVDLAEVAAGAVADVRDDVSGDVSVRVPEGVRVESDPAVLSLVVSSLVENALVHGDGSAEVEYAGVAGQSVRLTVSDDGPGIPDHELSVLDAGVESALEHGSGIGLWVVTWGMTALGGDVEFETPPEGGTVATLRVPGLVAAPDDDRTA
jgi:signal transduction histidine kinase